MAKLAAFLTSFFGSMFGLVSQWMSTKVGIGIAITTLFLSTTYIFYTAAKALVAGVVMAVPYEPFVMGFWACWPSNAETCIAAIFGMDVASYVYRYKINLMATLCQL